MLKSVLIRSLKFLLVLANKPCTSWLKVRRVHGVVAAIAEAVEASNSGGHESNYTTSGAGYSLLIASRPMSPGEQNPACLDGRIGSQRRWPNPHIVDNGGGWWN